MASDFSARLRAATWDEHQATESAGYVTTLVAGGLTRDGYAAMVAQHWFIYQVLEQAAAAMRDDPVAGAVVYDGLARVPALRADLAFLLGPDWPDRIAPSPATTVYRDRLREVCFDWPAGFIAHHYTRYLGDLSGGQSIRRAVVRRYGFRGGQGVAFYDFRELGSPAAFKRGYRTTLDALPGPAAELDRLVGEVRLAYRLNAAVFADLERDTQQFGDACEPNRGRERDPFPPEVVEQIMRHMNDDHADDSLLIVQALGGRPAATAVRMSGMDADGIDFTVSGESVPVRVPFSHRLSERAEVRLEVVRMYQEACAALGRQAATPG
jgi:heme oxygenase